MSLTSGTPAPLFSAPSHVNPQFHLESLGGRYVVLAFLPEPGPARTAALKLVDANRELFQDERALFFGVLPDEASFAGYAHAPPFRWFADFDGAIRQLYGAQDGEGRLEPRWVVLDPALRVLGWGLLADGERLLRRLADLGDPDLHAGGPLHAPVLIAPRIFEPELCRDLIGLYGRSEPGASGVMRVVDGKTVGVLDSFKSRRDVFLGDETLTAALRVRIAQRLLPEVEKAFQFRATQIERFVVACYDAAEGGHFNAHRDNRTPATAHRRFAVSINLNAEDYEGGDLRFPEFGRRTYRPPTGGAVVFSCSLLHEATPVTRGARYVFLPFLYDDEGARIRQANLREAAAT